MTMHEDRLLKKDNVYVRVNDAYDVLSVCDAYAALIGLGYIDCGNLTSEDDVKEASEEFCPWLHFFKHRTVE